MILDKIEGIKFEPEAHTYTLNGISMLSVTKLLNDYEPEFDAEKISYFVARKKVREINGWKEGEPDDETMITLVQQEVLAEWDQRRDEAADHGTNIHKIMEDAVNDNILPDQEADPQGLVQSFVKEGMQVYSEMASEVAIASAQFGIAGKTDFVAVRKTRTRILDFEDFKSNLHKGIRFDSISRKNGVIKHDNKFFKAPLNHLELCNYNRYAMQLSIYALLFELWFQCQIGKIGIRWIEMDNAGAFSRMFYIPIPYMRSDAMRMMIEYSQAHPVTQLNDENW